MTPWAGKILAVLLSFPVYGEDVRLVEDKRIQLETIATATANATADRNTAALMLASGWEETGWSLRVHSGRCRPFECDHGKARGPWQVQRNEMSKESWDQMTGLENTDAQARTVAKRIDFWRYRCGNTWGVISRYLGLPCRSEAKQVARRFRTYKEVLSALEP